MEYRPEWGYYHMDQYPMGDDIKAWLDRASVCWLPKHLSMKEYSVEQVQDITEWLIDNTHYAWEGPIGYMGFWKFRFSNEIDIIAFKLYI